MNAPPTRPGATGLSPLPVGARPPLMLTAIPGQVTIAVCSQKGGCGKTTTTLGVAATIANASAAAGQPLSVAVIDGDTGDGQISLLLEVYEPNVAALVGEPVIDQRVLKQAMHHVEDLGIDVLLAPLNPADADRLTPDFWRHVVRVAKSIYDVIVIDNSVNYRQPLVREVFIPEANSVLFVTDVDKASVMGMSRALRVLLSSTPGCEPIPPGKLALVVNKAQRGLGTSSATILDAATPHGHATLRVAGSVPADHNAVQLARNRDGIATLLTHPRIGPAWLTIARAALGQTRPLAPIDTAPADPETPPGNQIALVEHEQVPTAPRRRWWRRART